MTTTKEYEVSIQWDSKCGWWGWIGLRDKNEKVGDEFITGYSDCRKTVADKLRETARKLGYKRECIYEIGKEERKAKMVEE